MYTISFDTPLMGRMTELHTTKDSAIAALVVAARRFKNVTINGVPYPIEARDVPAVAVPAKKSPCYCDSAYHPAGH